MSKKSTLVDLFSPKALEPAEELIPIKDNSEELYERDYDPTKLLPFTKVLEESGPEVERLPGVYQGSIEKDFLSNG